MLRTVYELIEDQVPQFIPSSASIMQASVAMEAQRVRAMVVVEDDELQGVLSERDVVYKCVAKGLSPDTTTVAEIMTRNVKFVAHDAPIAKALNLMAQGAFHHIPIVKDGKVVGLLDSDHIPEEHRMLLERYKARSTRLSSR